MADDKQERGKAIEAALAQIDKQFGTGSIMRLGSREKVDIPAIPTGSLSLDAALGVGGMPRGRVVEIYGPESSGKTEEAGLPMKMGLIRNHYIGRTFIQPQQSIRHFNVRVKLNPVRSILEGKRVILIDDSIVRGTTSRKIVKIVKAAGASEVLHLRIRCPPTISPCFYGVDTPSCAELIAATHTIDEIRKYVEADSLAYLSLDGLRQAVGSEQKSYCTSCYTGVYPVAFPRNEQAYLQLALKNVD